MIPEAANAMGSTNESFSVAFSSDGNILASGAQDNTIKVWDVSNRGNFPLLQTISLDGVGKIAFSPDGKNLAIASSNKKVEIWDSREKGNFKLIRTLEDFSDQINSLAFSPDGKILVLGTVDVILLDTNNYLEIKLLNIGNEYSVSDIRFSLDGTMLAAAIGDGTLRLWNINGSNAEELKVITGHSEAVNQVAFSPDSETIYSVSTDMTVKRINTNLKNIVAHACQDLLPHFTTFNLKKKPSYEFKEKDKISCEKIIDQQSAYLMEVENYQYYSLAYKWEAERAIALNPNLSTAYIYKFVNDTFSDNTKIDKSDSNPDFQKALELAKDKKETVYFERGYAYRRKVALLKMPEENDPLKEEKLKEYNKKVIQLYEKTIVEYKKALNIQPNYPRAKSALNAVEVAFARFLIRESVDKGKEELFEKALEVRKASQEEVYFFRGAIYSEKINNDPTFVEPNEDDPLKEKKKKEIQDKKIGLYKKSIFDYEKATAIKPDDFYLSELNSIQAKYAHFHGNIFLGNKNYPKAIEEYTKAIEFEPEVAFHYSERGYTFQLNNEHIKAIEDFTKAIELKPEDASYYSGRAYVYKLNKEYVKAINDYTQAIKLKPEAYYYIDRAYVYKLNKEYVKAIEDYTQAIKSAPTDPYYYKERGDFYYSNKDLANANEDYSKAVSLYEKSIKAEPKTLYNRLVGKLDLYKFWDLKYCPYGHR